MIENTLRHHYQRFFVAPLAERIKFRIHPNCVTVIAAVLGLLIIPALYFHQTLLAIILILVSGYCDTLDGTIARLLGQSSDFGCALDICMDRLVELSIILGLFLMDPSGRGLYCLLMLGSSFLCVTSFLVVGVFALNDSSKGFHYSPGIMERAEAFGFFIALILLPHFFAFIALLYTGLVLLTSVIRLYEFYRSY